VFYFDLKCSKDMKLQKMPFFISSGTGLEFCPDATNIPESLMLRENTTYNVGFNLNRTVVGIKRNVLIFQFNGFSLCRYLSFQIHEQNSTLHVSHNAQLPPQNMEFPVLKVVNVVKQSKPVAVAVKKVMPKIPNSNRCLKGVKPPMYSLMHT